MELCSTVRLFNHAPRQIGAASKCTLWIQHVTSMYQLSWRSHLHILDMLDGRHYIQRIPIGQLQNARVYEGNDPLRWNQGALRRAVVRHGVGVCVTPTRDSCNVVRIDRLRVRLCPCSALLRPLSNRLHFIIVMPGQYGSGAEWCNGSLVTTCCRKVGHAPFLAASLCHVLPDCVRLFANVPPIQHAVAERDNLLPVLRT